jgi:hypothetical protein
MMKPSLLISLLGSVVLSACAADTVYRNLYNGLESYDVNLKNQPIPPRPLESHMPYEQYKAEREKLQEKNTETNTEKPRGTDRNY